MAKIRQKFVPSPETARGAKNKSEPMDPQEGMAKFAESSQRDEDALIVDPKMIHPDFEIIKSLDAEKKAKIDALAFMNEMVTVDILESQKEEDDEMFIIEVNERKAVFRRGERTTVPRWAVEGLARAKPIGFTSQEYYKADGTRDIRWPSRRGERYPFAVFHDPNPDGQRWLQQVRAQP